MTLSRSRTTMLILLTLGGLTIACGASLGAQSADGRTTAPAKPSHATAPAADGSHPVFTLFMSGIAAFNRHSLDPFMEQFADDIIMYTPTGWLKGRSAVRERFVETFRDFPQARMEIDSLEVRSVGPNAATVAFKWRTFPHGKGPAFHGVGSGAYLLRDGRWVEVLEHETIVRIDSALATKRSSSK